jgi:threonine/homoserine/homoserine lactone efflux protein
LIWDVTIGFEPALLVEFILAGLILNLTLGANFIFISESGISRAPRIGTAAALRARVGFLNKLTAILFGGLAARLIID